MGRASLSLTMSSPADAMHAEEVERTRVFAKLSVALTAFLIVGLPFFAGNNVMRYVLVGAVVGCFLQSLWVVHTLRDPARYDPRWVTMLALWAALTTFIGIVYVGIFSIGPAAIIVGIYFLGRSQIRGIATLIYVTTASLQAGAAVLFISGAVVDPGIFTAAGVDPVVAVFIQILVQLLYAIAFALSRASRLSSLEAMHDLQNAMQQVAQREALYQEVRAELDNALMLEGAGRYTDQEIGSFRLGMVIGRGAMAEVYEATNTTTGEPAAVKLLHPNMADSGNAVQRFLREARAAGALSSPNAVKVLEASPPGAPTPYLAMELLTGHDLAYWLRKRRRLSIPEVVDLVQQVAGVIDLAADAGTVHRDLKPHNMFRHEPEDGLYEWKVLDFGMSTLGEHAGTLTGGRVIGTPAYMAPEQARGKAVDSRADLYSLAAVAYRCVTGRPPFAGKDIPSLLYSVVYDVPVQPSTLRDIPEQLDHVLAVALAKDRDNRFASGAELSAAFAAAAEGDADDWLARRAEALVLEHPWGSRGDK